MVFRGSFNQTLDAISKERATKTILALDLDYRKDVTGLLHDAKTLVKKVSHYVCAVKVNYHLIVPLSLSQISSLNDQISNEGLISIADIKLNDIGNTNSVTTKYLWNCGFAGVIVNPFAGYKGALDAVYESASKLRKGVISLAYMSHEGADEGFGLKLEGRRTIFGEFLKRAVKWKSSGVIIGTTRPRRISIARKFLGSGIKIICPGTGTQGGDAASALRAGADYIIVGRSIIDSHDSADSARHYQSLASITTRYHHEERSSRSRR
jgi:orotidine-5'-phosphate decarboxylase